MRKVLGSEIVLYEEMVKYLPEYTDEEEVFALFVTRDVISVRLTQGEKADPELLALLARADNTLVELWRWLSSTFPNIFDRDRKATIPPDYWWWHLDEGPDVREQAKASEAA